MYPVKFCKCTTIHQKLGWVTQYDTYDELCWFAACLQSTSQPHLLSSWTHQYPQHDHYLTYHLPCCHASQNIHLRKISFYSQTATPGCLVTACSWKFSVHIESCSCQNAVGDHDTSTGFGRVLHITNIISLRTSCKQSCEQDSHKRMQCAYFTTN